MKKILKILGVLTLLGLLLIVLINFYVLSFSKGKIIKDINNIEKTRVGLVFGARVYSNGNISPILADRLDVAGEAYKAGLIDRIIVSGDNSTSHYDEPTNMKEYLVLDGIVENHIYIDYAGFDTYDSIYRANYIFGISDIVLFTQEYHLKRAMYIASRLGLKNQGVSTDLQSYNHIDYYNRREVLSRIKAFLNVDILKSKPKFLGERIEIK